MYDESARTTHENKSDEEPVPSTDASFDVISG